MCYKSKMKNLRCYYSASVQTFLAQSSDLIFGILAKNDASAETTQQQRNAWEEEITILKQELALLDEGRVLFEYMIPRRGKRVDAVLLHKGIVFLLEFKCGETEFHASTYEQVYDYALDLHYFQKASEDKLLVPIMIPTRAAARTFTLCYRENVLCPIGCNKDTIATTIAQVVQAFPQQPLFDYSAWETAEYCPTPTIVEAAQALYGGHEVEEITRNDAGAENLSRTTAAINAIIAYSKQHNQKAICFVTGVPGAGKTLVGLNLAVQHSHAAQLEPAVFLSGNFPLVTVLQSALTRDKLKQARQQKKRLKKKDVQRETSTFIQIIHKYRDSFVNNTNLPPERVTIFDEAQRAWTQKQIAKFMKAKKRVSAFPYSEPEFLIQTMDRHTGWAVIVCLVGGGQEINDGEAGLPEWFDALRRSFPNWHVYLPANLNDEVYTRGRSWEDLLANLRVTQNDTLHLATSLRSFRTPALSTFVDALLNLQSAKATQLLETLKDKYPLVLTRDLATAKKWLREQCRGSQRCGILTSSGALRLKAVGLFVKNQIQVDHWFLDTRDDVRSSYQLEDVATEFDVQGLELDFALVAWDADFRHCANRWQIRAFHGTAWQTIRDEEKRRYRKNAYRVLLTRARQGMVLFVPNGDKDDATRLPEYYDGTYTYLKALGIPEL